MGTPEISIAFKMKVLKKFSKTALTNSAVFFVLLWAFNF